MMDIVDCVDSNNRPTGQTLSRDGLKGASCYFRVVHLWWTHAGQWLVQKRGKADDLNPYMWAFTTGLVTTGETPLSTVIRETQEELGVTLSPDSLRLVKIVPTHTGAYHTFAYIYHLDHPPLPMRLSDEVLATDWWDFATIQGKIKDTRFWNYPKLLDAPDYFDEDV